MHIGFDGLFLEQPYTGSGQYARALLPELAGRPGLRLTVLRPEPAAPEGVAAAAGLATVGLPAPTRRARPRKVWWEQRGLPRAAAAAGVDLIHVPYFAAPSAPGRPLVVTVHDVIPLSLPLYAGSLAMRLYLELVRRTVARADAVLTDSAAARRELLARLHLPPERVAAVPLAVGPTFRPVSADEAAPTLDRLGVRPPYLLNVGGFDARKNLPALIEAAARAFADRPDWQLVIVGRPHSGNRRLYPPIGPLLAAAGLAERTVLTGFVSDEEKAALYARADLCVFPTLAEGFGLPPLEAMACGAPVLASDRSSLPEVVGAAGALVDTADLAAFAAALAALLDSPARRAALATAGRARAATFTWARTADGTLTAYRRALDGPAPRPAGGRLGLS